MLGALAGLLAAAVALGAGELVAGVVGPASSPVVAVGNAVVALTPEPVKDAAIATFGRADKVALVTGTLVLLAGYAVLIGLVALRRPRLGVAGVVVLGLLGALAALTRPAAGPFDVLPSLVGTAAGVLALLALLGRLSQPRDPAAPGGGAVDRRRFLVISGVTPGTLRERSAPAGSGAGRLGIGGRGSGRHPASLTDRPAATWRKPERGRRPKLLT